MLSQSVESQESKYVSKHKLSFSSDDNTSVPNSMFDLPSKDRSFCGLPPMNPAISVASTETSNLQHTSENRSPTIARGPKKPKLKSPMNTSAPTEPFVMTAPLSQSNSFANTMGSTASATPHAPRPRVRPLEVEPEYDQSPSLKMSSASIKSTQLEASPETHHPLGNTSFGSLHGGSPSIQSPFHAAFTTTSVSPFQTVSSSASPIDFSPMVNSSQFAARTSSFSASLSKPFTDSAFSSFTPRSAGPTSSTPSFAPPQPRHSLPSVNGSVNGSSSLRSSSASVAAGQLLAPPIPALVAPTSDATPITSRRRRNNQSTVSSNFLSPNSSAPNFTFSFNPISANISTPNDSDSSVSGVRIIGSGQTSLMPSSTSGSSASSLFPTISVSARIPPPSPFVKQQNQHQLLLQRPPVTASHHGDTAPQHASLPPVHLDQIMHRPFPSVTTHEQSPFVVAPQPTRPKASLFGHADAFVNSMNNRQPSIDDDEEEESSIAELLRADVHSSPYRHRTASEHSNSVRSALFSSPLSEAPPHSNSSSATCSLSPSLETFHFSSSQSSPLKRPASSSPQPPSMPAFPTSSRMLLPTTNSNIPSATSSAPSFQLHSIMSLSPRPGSQSSSPQFSLRSSALSPSLPTSDSPNFDTMSASSPSLSSRISLQSGLGKPIARSAPQSQGQAPLSSAPQERASPYSHFFLNLDDNAGQQMLTVAETPRTPFSPFTPAHQPRLQAPSTVFDFPSSAHLRSEASTPVLSSTSLPLSSATSTGSTPMLLTSTLSDSAHPSRPMTPLTQQALRSFYSSVISNQDDSKLVDITTSDSSISGAASSRFRFSPTAQLLAPQSSSSANRIPSTSTIRYHAPSTCVASRPKARLDAPSTVLRPSRGVSATPSSNLLFAPLPSSATSSASSSPRKPSLAGSSKTARQLDTEAMVQSALRLFSSPVHGNNSTVSGQPLQLFDNRMADDQMSFPSMNAISPSASVVPSSRVSTFHSGGLLSPIAASPNSLVNRNISSSSGLLLLDDEPSPSTLPSASSKFSVLRSSKRASAIERSNSPFHSVSASLFSAEDDEDSNECDKTQTSDSSRADDHLNLVGPDLINDDDDQPLTPRLQDLDDSTISNVSDSFSKASPASPAPSSHASGKHSDNVHNNVARSQTYPPSAARVVRVAPDQSVFDRNTMRRKHLTPQPPSPERPIALRRKASLWDSKLLLSPASDALNSSQSSTSSSHSAMSASASALSTSATLHHNDHFSFTEEFEDVHHIGSGNFFDVFSARNKHDRHIYAVKKSKSHFRSRNDRDHYLREAKTIREIGSGSDHIVTLYQAWQEEGHFYIQLEYCPLTLIGLLRHQPQVMQDLAASAQRVQQPSVAAIQSSASSASSDSVPESIGVGEAFIRRVAHDVGVGLVHVHQHNMVHLDIKPENILVSTDGKLKIGDFGSAILRGMQADGSEGDVVYMAPELISNNSSARSVASCAADVFSLGIMLFEMATQTELPLSGPLWISLRQGGGRDLLHGRVSATLEHWIMRMMDPSPVTRPTALDVVTAALWPLPVPLTLHQ